MKKRRKTTPRERALVRAANEVIWILDEDHCCSDCRRRRGDDERHDETCIVTQLRRALRVQ